MNIVNYAVEGEKCDAHTDANIYIEELVLSEDLEVGIFDKNTKYVFLISANNVIAYDVHSGNRFMNFYHNDRVIGLAFYNEMMITYTSTFISTFWNVDEGRKILVRELKFLEGYQPVWFYEFAGKHYILAADPKRVAGEAAIFQIPLDNIKTFSDNEEKKVQAKIIAKIGAKPTKRRHLAIGKGFCIKCDKKIIKMIKFGKFSADESDDDAEESPEEKIPKKTEFSLLTHFNVIDQGLVEFDEVHIAGDSLFASLNIGRVYSWSRFPEAGIGPWNMSHLTLTGHRSTICTTEQGTIYIGTGKGLIYKYNLAGASGVGRWHKLEYLQMDAPPCALSLNTDSSILAALLSDNTLCIIRCAGMKIVARAEVLNRSQINDLPDYCFGIVNDPADDGLLIANARVGHIQWINPFQWKTTNLLDIAEENVPHEDTFNAPNMLWLNAYLINATPMRIATCECRRENPEKTYLKFWRKLGPASSNFELEDCHVLMGRMVYIRSTLDDLQGEMAADMNEEFLCVDSHGKMDVYKKDEKRRKAHWCQDLGRHEQNWQRTSVEACSKIRENTFATINRTNGPESVDAVVLWDFGKMRILRVLDNLEKANQVDWSSHQPGILLISCHSGIVAFNNIANAFIWAILQNGLSIASNRISTFLYDERQVFIIDPSLGTVKKDKIRFSRPQKCIIALKRGGKTCFCGITDKGSLSLLRTNIEDGEEQSADWKGKQKRTAFSRLNAIKKENARTCPTMEESNTLSRNIISIRKFTNGPAYSLPPITILTERFVKTCLSGRRNIHPSS